MTASAAGVEAAQKAMGCERVPNFAGLPICRTGPWRQYHGVWTERGCPVAVTVADAVVAAAQPRIAAGVTRDLADLLAPFSGIGMANGATRADVSHWLRIRADEIDKGGNGG